MHSKQHIDSTIEKEMCAWQAVPNAMLWHLTFLRHFTVSNTEQICKTEDEKKS